MTITDPFQAIRLNEVGVVEYIKELPDINILDEEGCSLLQEAIAYERTELALLLIAQGIDVNITDGTGQTAMHSAALYGNINVAKNILNAGYNPEIKDNHGNSPLWTAVFNFKSDLSMVCLLTEGGLKGHADVKNNAGMSPLDLAIDYGIVDLVNALN